MNTKIAMIIPVILSLIMVSCGVDYKKTKSGLVYKIFPGGSKDSLAGGKNKLKFQVIQKINDSVLFTSYDKMPIYQEWANDPRVEYTPFEIIFMMKKGDSATIIQMFDSLVRRGQQRQYPMAKKGDRITTYVKVLDIFRDDSTYEKDFNAEMVKDKPRQDKEMKEQEEKQKAEMAKRIEEFKKQQAKEIEELRSSGGIEKQEKEVLDYLAKKKITNFKKAGGTYVVVKEKGNGVPALKNKFIHVKYAGRALATDSVFQANEYIFPLGQEEVIKGWDEGITEFNKGGKGTLYIPGYLAYGSSPGPTNVPWSALIFEVEILNVSDTREKAEAEKAVADSVAASKKLKKVN